MSQAAAALLCLESAARYGFEYVQLECDALNMLTAINGGMDGSSPLHLIYDSIVALCPNFMGFSCSFVKRNGNTLVHLVARWDIGSANEKIWMDPFPQKPSNLS